MTLLELRSEAAGWPPTIDLAREFAVFEASSDLGPRPQLRDPADELVLEAAVNGRAEALVTFDRRDFGNRRDFGAVPVGFGIDVLTPAEAIRRIRK